MVAAHGPVHELVATVAEVSGKKIQVKHVDGPVGVRARNFSKARIHSLGWRPEVSLSEGIARTYEWIEERVRNRSVGVPVLGDALVAGAAGPNTRT